jgi:hypothetical protein
MLQQESYTTLDGAFYEKWRKSGIFLTYTFWDEVSVNSRAAGRQRLRH